MSAGQCCVTLKSHQYGQKSRNDFFCKKKKKSLLEFWPYSTHILIPGFWVPKKFLNNTSSPKSMYEPTPAVPAINVGEHTMGISFIFQLVGSFSNFFRTHQMSRIFLNQHYTILPPQKKGATGLLATQCCLPFISDKCAKC